MITFSLPYPPSVNQYWRKRKGQQKNYISEAGKKFRADVLAIAFTQRIKKSTGLVAVTLVPYPPDLRERDGDNLWKAVLDGLVSAGVIPGDSNRVIRREVLEWGPKVKGGRLDVIIEPYRPRLEQIQKSFTNN